MPISKYLCKSFVLTILVLLNWPDRALAEWYSEAQGIMGTDVQVTLWHDRADLAQQAMASVMQEMRRIEQAYSPYIDTSELYRVNANAYDSAQPVSAEMSKLIDKSLYFSRITEGAFDITYASVGRYYDYRNKLKPSEQKRLAALPAIDYRWLALDRDNRSLAFKHERVRIDLGGVAKGYAVDRAIALLREQGIRHASVSAGGDSRLLGDRRGRPWIIGIKNPRRKPSQAEAVIRLPLDNVAVSTSGDYERFFIDEDSNERVHHILNPGTGKSASELISVTILGESGFDTDPLSTSVFVLGVEKGLALVNRLPGFDAIIIDKYGKVHYSDGLQAGE